MLQRKEQHRKKKLVVNLIDHKSLIKRFGTLFIC